MIDATICSFNILLVSEGRPEVLELLDPESPFQGRRPPKFIRAKLYKYHFAEDDWWRREEVGEYLPVLTLDNPQLISIMRDQGVLGHSVQELRSSVLTMIRDLSKLSSTEVQIWSYAWISLPLLLPFISPN